MSQQQTKMPHACPAVLTRPGPLPDNPLRQSLMDQGVMCHIPVIELEATGQGHKLAQELWCYLSHNHQPIMLLLTSPSAAAFLGQSLKQSLNKEQWQELFASWSEITVACVGEKTRQRFQQICPELKKPGQWLLPPGGQEESRHLAHTIRNRFHKLSNHPPITILHPTGDKKSGDWAQWLAHPTFAYQRWTLYHNRPNLAAQTLLAQKLGLSIDWLFFSPSAVEALLELSGASAAQQTTWRAFCIGSVTADKCRDKGFAFVYCSSQADETIMLQEYLDVSQGKGLFP